MPKDGKKRIAALRNQAKRLGLQVALGFQARAGPAKPGPVEVIVIDGVPMDLKHEAVLAKSVPKPKTGTFSSARAFGEALMKRGFKQLGSGAYSTVYGKDGYDKVVKVSRCLDNWIDYVMWASSAGYAGTFAPKVYSWKRFKNSAPKKKNLWDCYDRWNEDEWSVAIVERMKETLNAKSDLAADFKIIERIHDLSERSILAELLMDEVIPGVGSFFKKLHKNFCANDVYGKNLMIREDGTFCVTDPVCGSIKTGAMRFKAGDFSPPLVHFGDHESSCRY